MSGDSQLERLLEWSDVLDDSSYYELLGVLELADQDAIRVAFREFALSFHPDSHVGESAERRELLHRVYRRGAEAYRVLTDPVLRAKYDERLAHGHLRLEGGEPTGPAAGALKSLEEICNSPAARLSARRADECIGEGRLLEARRLLRDALAHDGSDNAELEERLEALETALFAMGS